MNRKGIHVFDESVPVYGLGMCVLPLPIASIAHSRRAQVAGRPVLAIGQCGFWVADLRLWSCVQRPSQSRRVRNGRRRVQILAGRQYRERFARAPSATGGI
jgi:hypothetical protein